MLVFFSFPFGLIVGSFLNVVIYRLHRQENILGRSACPHCRHRLTAADLLPLASFVLLKGRCRYCHKPISWQYPLVELATGIVFALLASQLFRAGSFSSALVLLLEFFFAALLIVIFVFDLRYYLIPDLPVAAGAAAALIYRLLPQQEAGLLTGLAGGAVVCGLFGFLYLMSQGRWIGLGDVKLGVFLGLLLGFSGSLAMLFLAYVSGAFVGIAMIFLGKRTIRGKLPFGTFLSAATVIVMLWGKELVAWYVGNFYL